jgi:predicted RNA binding protein YcfA (HicA-like mRNA interferase family)
MGARAYPPLTPSEVVGILNALQFKFKRQAGSHAHYERLPDEELDERKIVTVDMTHSQFSVRMIKSMISQSGFKRHEFYKATKGTAKKI